MVTVLQSLTRIIAAAGRTIPPHPNVRRVKSSEPAHICGADKPVFIYSSVAARHNKSWQSQSKKK